MLYFSQCMSIGNTLKRQRIAFVFVMKLFNTGIVGKFGR